MLAYPPPMALVLAQMCEVYHVLPSQLMEEDADNLLRFWRIARSYDYWVSKRPKWLRNDGGETKKLLN